MNYARTRYADYRDAARRVALFSYEHALFLGGLAGMSYALWMVSHPLGVFVGSWFAVRMALSGNSPKR